MERLGKGIHRPIAFFSRDLTQLLFHKNNRTRESSVVISPQWTMLEEVEFHRLAKLRLEVDEPEELWVFFITLQRQFLS